MPMLNVRLDDEHWDRLNAAVAQSGAEDRSAYVRMVLYPTLPANGHPHKPVLARVEPRPQPEPAPRREVPKPFVNCGHKAVRVVNGGIRVCKDCGKVLPNARVR